MEEESNYYAIIPANVRYNENLNSSQKLFYAEITSFARKTGMCWASNNYFSRLYKVSTSTICNWVKTLEKENLITIEYVRNGKEIEKRIIRIVGSQKTDYVVNILGEGSQNIDTGYSKNSKEINKNIINNKEINNTKEIYKERFIKPTLEEVKKYCNERNNSVDPEYFIDYYESKGWLVGKTKMKDWKAAVRLWERKTTKKKDRQKEIDEMCKRLAYLDEEE